MGRQVITAETDEGRRAIEDVMSASYEADIGRVPLAWARALLVDGTPVSFILVYPDVPLPFPRGPMRTAFVTDTATREDRRHEGHFRALMESTLADLRADGVPAVKLHGEAQLYRRFGFGVYARHAALFFTAELVERRLGAGTSDGWESRIEVEDRRGVRPDLLVVNQARAQTISEARALIQTAAALARERGKRRIMVACPASPLRGPRCPFTEAPLTAMALACGGRLVLQGADPEGRACEHADWIKVLDTPRFVQEAVGLQEIEASQLPHASVRFETDAGSVAIRTSAKGVEVLEAPPDAQVLTWPSTALAQLVMGYSSAAVLAEIHHTVLREDVLRLLDALFPRQWRLSENDDWIFGK